MVFDCGRCIPPYNTDKHSGFNSMFASIPLYVSPTRTYNFRLERGGAYYITLDNRREFIREGLINRAFIVLLLISLVGENKNIIL